MPHWFGWHDPEWFRIMILWLGILTVWFGTRAPRNHHHNRRHD